MQWIMQELAIGIDLGTTNGLIAVWKDGAAQLIPNKFGEYLTPSIISMDENNHILVETGCITADFASG